MIAEAALRSCPPAPDGACTVEVIGDKDAFVRLQAAWNEAVARARVAHPFLRHEWLRTWWEAFGRRAALHVLVVRSGGRIIGLAPLMRDKGRICGVLVRRLRLLQNDHTPRIDVVVTERHADVYRAMWQAMRAVPWDVLQLNQVPRDSATHEVFRALAAADGCRTGTWPSGDAPYLALRGAWEELQARLPSKFRSNLRNRLSRLQRLGDPSLEVLDAPDEMARAAGDVWRLERSGWKDEARTAIVSDPDVHRFYAQLIPRAAAAGWLRLLFLRAGGRRIAAAYAAVFDGRLLLVKTGYDPAYAACAPFKLLTYLAARHGCAIGWREIDFLGDAEPWKLEWTDAVRSHDWLFIFSDTFRARLLHWTKFRCMPELKRWYR